MGRVSCPPAASLAASALLPPEERSGLIHAEAVAEILLTIRGSEWSRMIQSTRCNAAASLKAPVLTFHPLVGHGALEGAGEAARERLLVIAQLLKPLRVAG